MSGASVDEAARRGIPLLLFLYETDTTRAAKVARWASNEGDVLTVAGVELHALLTPVHSPGGISMYAPALGSVFGGDTLFKGGPGNTALPHSDFATIIDSIRTTLFRLPQETVVRPGHGDTTTIGSEAPHLDEWITRGW